jgi:hypothetical protein
MWESREAVPVLKEKHGVWDLRPEFTITHSSGVQNTRNL